MCKTPYDEYLKQQRSMRFRNCVTVGLCIFLGVGSFTLLMFLGIHWIMFLERLIG